MARPYYMYWGEHFLSCLANLCPNKTCDGCGRIWTYMLFTDDGHKQDILGLEVMDKLIKTDAQAKGERV